MRAVRFGWTLVLVAAFWSTEAWAGDLVLKRVMLATSGVGYFEHEAEITGDAELTLDVPLDQIDDVLKSIVVYDSQGGIGSARLAGREPLTQLFRDLPFGPEALASPTALLNALQGAEVRVGSTRQVTGKLLKVVSETTRLSDGATTTRDRVTLMTAAGLQQFILEDAESIAFADAELQAKLDKALTEIAAHRAKDRREIVLSAHGKGARKLRIGYVVTTPLWKASYRLTLPPSAEAKAARLQGWAVLENMSGNDWQGVELTLLSGDPVSFHQAIYQSYYVNRPEVPIEVASRVLPLSDTGTLQKVGIVGGSAAAAPAATLVARAAAPAQQQFRDGLEEAKKDYDRPRSDVAAALARAVNAAEAEEGVTQVAFRLPAPVTIASGQSAIVPIFDGELPTERLALYQHDASATYPFAALSLQNDQKTGLPPGVLTLYEESAAGAAYLGDARLSRFPAGESRLLSYAVDSKTKVAREEHWTSTLRKGTAARGVLTLSRVERATTTYKVSAPASEARRLVIEQPKRAGWTLVDPEEKNVAQTAAAYRMIVDLKPGEGKTVAVTFERIVAESQQIADLGEAQIVTITETGGIDPALKKALAELVRLRQGASDKAAAQARIKAQIDALRDDNQRLRDNLAQVDAASALHKRYMAKLDALETQFEKLQGELAKAEEEANLAHAAVNDFIAKLQL